MVIETELPIGTEGGREREGEGGWMEREGWMEGGRERGREREGGRER